MEDNENQKILKHVSYDPTPTQKVFEKLFSQEILAYFVFEFLIEQEKVLIKDLNHFGFAKHVVLFFKDHQDRSIKQVVIENRRNLFIIVLKNEHHFIYEFKCFEYFLTV